MYVKGAVKGEVQSLRDQIADSARKGYIGPRKPPTLSSPLPRVA